MARFLLILLGIVVILAGITILVWRVSLRAKLVKYVPAVVCLVLGVYYLYLARTVHEGFADLANAILAMMLFTGFVSGLVTSLLIDFVLPRFKS